jgi:hypothetical protein
MDTDKSGGISQAEMSAGQDKMMSKDKAKDEWGQKEKGSSASAGEHAGHDAAAAAPPAEDNGG